MIIGGVSARMNYGARIFFLLVGLSCLLHLPCNFQAGYTVITFGRGLSRSHHHHFSCFVAIVGHTLRQMSTYRLDHRRTDLKVRTKSSGGETEVRTEEQGEEKKA